MLKNSTKGFAVAGFVGLLSLALLLGVVGLTAFSALKQNSNPDSQAAAPQDNAKFDEIVVAKDADMGLKVVPALSSDFGKVNLAVSWNSDVREKLKKEHGTLDRFRLTVRRKPFVNVDTNLISNINDSLVAADKSTKSFSNLAVDNDQTYYVQLRAVYTNDLNKKTEVKMQRVEFKYYGDRFEANNIDSFWSVFQDGKYSKVSMSPDSKKKTLIAEVLKGKGTTANVNKNFDLSKGFSSSVDITNIALPGIGKSNHDKSLVGQFFNKAGTNFSYGAWIENTSKGLTVSSGQSRAIQSGFDYTYGKSLAFDGTYPVKLSFNYDGERISSKFGSQDLDSNSGVKIDSLNLVQVGSWTAGPNANATGMFNNFQIVWVKADSSQ